MTNSWSFLFDERYGDDNMSETHPDNIKLDSPAKMFEYEKMARTIDQCENVEELQLTLKSVLKTYMRYQETTAKALTMPPPR